MNPTAMIRLSNVCLFRGEKIILNKINWSIPAGACAAILGPNGSGKSTIARILACHLWPTSGSVAVMGQEFGHANLPELRRQIRLVQPAGPYDIDPSLSVRQVVLTGFFGTLNLYDRVNHAMIETADRQIDRMGLNSVAEHPYSTLSSGERVRSLIARSLVAGPKLLLLDEPTAGLDLRAREQVLATVQNLSTQPDPPTLILISHHVEELPPATSNVLLLSGGCAVASGTPAEVLRGEILSRAYACPVTVRQNRGRFYVEVSPEAWSGLL